MSDADTYTVNDLENLKEEILTAVEKQYENRPPDGFVPQENIEDAVEGAFDPYGV